MIKQRLLGLRSGSAPVSVITVRAVILASIARLRPEILEHTFHDGTCFRASESFVRKFLHDTMQWSIRKATRAAQKLPPNWEDQCEKSALRKAHHIKENDIPPELWVNSDQTQNLYAPGNKATWAETGAKQVSLVGGDEKRAFTIMVSVSASGGVLPFQAIYAGKTAASRPSSKAPYYTAAIAAGFKFVSSGNGKYWSNQKTMREFVDEILAPYFEAQKRLLNLPHEQKSLWTIDVWSVHRSAEFRAWMRTHHPTIQLDFVPGGCTGVAQPCDVGIQRFLKLSTKRSYHEDIVIDIGNQIDAGKTTLSVDDHLGTMRDSSVRWLWNAFNAINNKELVKKVSSTHTIRLIMN